MKKISTLFWTFLKIGAFTFGGGYAMVALLEHEFVEEKQWVSREEFLDMVAIAESTPGPVAVMFDRGGFAFARRSAPEVVVPVAVLRRQGVLHAAEIVKHRLARDAAVVA